MIAAMGHEKTSPPPSIAVIVSRYNGSITGKLLEGAIGEYTGRGGSEDDLGIYDAPGTYELTAMTLAAADTGRYRGIVALGCLIKGETRHDRYIAEAVAHGLMQVTLQSGVPVAFGVVTADTPEQARARAGGKKGNKGEEAMRAVLEAIEGMDAIRDGLRRRVLPGATDKAGAAGDGGAL